MASIGSLVADMRLESAAFRRDLGRATAATNSATAQMRRAMRSVEQQSRRVGRAFGQLRNAAGALAGALAVRQFARFADAAINTGDALAKQAKQLTIAASELQRYRIEGQIAGVATEKLETGIGAFTKRVGELRAGQGQLLTMLRRSNPALLEQLNNVNSTEEAMRVMLRAIRNSGSAFERQALSAAAFGRSAGQAMVLLADSAGTMDKEMVRLVTRSDEMLNASERLQDQITLLRAAFSAGFDQAIITAFAGSLSATVESMTEARKIGEQLGRAVGESLKVMIEAAKWAAENIRGIAAALGAVVAYKAAVMFGGMAASVFGLARALTVAAVAQRGLNLAMIANPIGLVGLAIAGAVAAYIKWKDETIEIGKTTLRVGNIVGAVWAAVTVPIRTIEDELINVGRIMWHLVNRDFKAAMSAAKNIGGALKLNIADVIAKLQPPTDEDIAKLLGDPAETAGGKAGETAGEAFRKAYEASLRKIQGLMGEGAAAGRAAAGAIGSATGVAGAVGAQQSRPNVELLRKPTAAGERGPGQAVGVEIRLDGKMLGFGERQERSMSDLATFAGRLLQMPDRDAGQDLLLDRLMMGMEAIVKENERVETEAAAEAFYRDAGRWLQEIAVNTGSIGFAKAA